jgi:hypothetical protein
MPRISHVELLYARGVQYAILECGHILKADARGVFRRDENVACPECETRPALPKPEALGAILGKVLP